MQRGQVLINDSFNFKSNGLHKKILMKANLKNIVYTCDGPLLWAGGKIFKGKN